MNIYKKNLKKKNILNFNKNKFWTVIQSLYFIKKFCICNFFESIDLSLIFSDDLKKSDILNIKDFFFFPYNILKFEKIIIFTNKLKIISISISMGLKNIFNNINSLLLFIKYKCIDNFKDIIFIYNNFLYFNFFKYFFYYNNFNYIFIFDDLDFKKFIYNYKIGGIYFKPDKYGNINISIGKSYFNLNFLKSNFYEFLKFLNFKKPLYIKGNFFKKVFLSSTMGKGFKISLIDINSNLI